MKHQHADIVAAHLVDVLDHATTIAAVTDSTHIDLTSARGFMAGDTVTVTTVSGDYQTRIAQLNDAQAVLSPAVDDMAQGDALRFKLPHTLLTYKSLSAENGIPLIKPPCVVVTLPAQPGYVGLRANSGADQVVLDRTRLAIYIETPFTFLVGDEKIGGFDALHLPAIEHIRRFLQAEGGLRIPDDIAATYRSGFIGLRSDNPPERTGRSADRERHIFFVMASVFTTLNEGTY
jgi:hypothetical protein